MPTSDSQDVRELLDRNKETRAMEFDTCWASFWMDIDASD